MIQATVILALLAALPQALSSSGDRSFEFWQCQQACVQEGCVWLPLGAPREGQEKTCLPTCGSSRSGGNRSQAACGAVGAEVPLALRLFRWDCAADCSYACMHAAERRKAVLNATLLQRHGQAVAGVEKYYGKWPFVRVMGMQEVVSVVASLANLAVHVVCVRGMWYALMPPRPVDGPQTPASYPFLSMWTVYGCIHVNAWWWSAVFHSRDTRTTERFDYCSAIVLVAYGLFAVLMRVMWSLPRRFRSYAMSGAGLLVFAGLVYHLHYMLRVKFNYSYNMKVCVTAGIATALTWLVWCSWTRHPGRRTMYAFLGLVHAAMLFEVLDFPPLLGLVDAHAVWHIATVPLTPLFYRWVLQDAEMADSKWKET